jgi:hypothetical protein
LVRLVRLVRLVPQYEHVFILFWQQVK